MPDKEAIVAAFFQDASIKGMESALREHGTDDVSWWICGMGDVTPQLSHLSAAFIKIFDERGIVIVPQRIISQGDFVTVEAVTDSVLRDGTEYKNTISYWVTFSGAKIASLREYFDSGYGERVIGAKLREALAG